MKLSFKKRPQERGLARVAYPYTGTEIKMDGFIVGSIQKNYRDNIFTGEKADDKWAISLTIQKEPTQEDQASFKWIRFKARFDKEEQAREFLKQNWTKITTAYKLVEP